MHVTKILAVLGGFLVVGVLPYSATRQGERDSKQIAASLEQTDAQCSSGTVNAREEVGLLSQVESTLELESDSADSNDLFAGVCCEAGGVCTWYAGPDCPKNTTRVSCPCNPT